MTTLVPNVFDLTPANDVLNKLDANFAIVPVVRAVSRAVGQIAAVTLTSVYPVGATDGTFEISANVNVTTATNHSFQVACSYTDETNSARVLVLSFSLVAGFSGGAISLVANANGTVPYMGIPQHIRAKAGTTISTATQGTFTTVVYNVETVLKQLA